MIRLVYRSDVHLAVQAPQSRTDDWAATVLNKLDQVGEIAREVKAQAILDGGDFFHIKMPSRTTHELVRQVASAHAGYVPTYGNIGNHDCKYGDYAFLPESPLGVLFDTGVFKRCYDQHEAVFTQTVYASDEVAAGRPNPGCDRVLKVRVVGIPYHGKKYDRNRLTTITKGDEDFLVVMAHLLASQEGGEMFGAEDIIPYADLANLDPDVWCFGHWHKNQGVVRVGNKTVVNIGSLTRGALTEDEVSRVPECAVLSFDVGEEVQVDRRPLKVQPAAEVFDLVGRTRQEARAMTVDAFVESVKTTLTQAPAESLLDQVRALSAPDQVKERLISYLEAEGAS